MAGDQNLQHPVGDRCRRFGCQCVDVGRQGADHADHQVPGAAVAANPAGHCARPDVTRLLFDPMRREAVVVRSTIPSDAGREGDDFATAIEQPHDAELEAPSMQHVA